MTKPLVVTRGAWRSSCVAIKQRTAAADEVGVDRSTTAEHPHHSVRLSRRHRLGNWTLVRSRLAARETGAANGSLETVTPCSSLRASAPHFATNRVLDALGILVGNLNTTGTSESRNAACCDEAEGSALTPSLGSSRADQVSSGLDNRRFLMGAISVHIEHEVLHSRPQTRFLPRTPKRKTKRERRRGLQRSNFDRDIPSTPCRASRMMTEAMVQDPDRRPHAEVANLRDNRQLQTDEGDGNDEACVENTMPCRQRQGNATDIGVAYLHTHSWYSPCDPTLHHFHNSCRSYALQWSFNQPDRRSTRAVQKPSIGLTSRNTIQCNTSASARTVHEQRELTRIAVDEAHCIVKGANNRSKRAGPLPKAQSFHLASVLEIQFLACR